MNEILEWIYKRIKSTKANCVIIERNNYQSLHLYTKDEYVFTIYIDCTIDSIGNTINITSLIMPIWSLERYEFTICNPDFDPDDIVTKIFDIFNLKTLDLK